MYLYERHCYYLLLILCLVFSLTYNTLPEPWEFLSEKIFLLWLILHLYFIKVVIGLSMVTLSELEPGSLLPHMCQSATESLKASGFRVSVKLTVATKSSFLDWSEQLVGFVFLHSSDIPELKCFHLAQQNPAKHVGDRGNCALEFNL